MDTVTSPRPGLLGQVWHFTRHFLEMCVAMCVGGAILNALVFLVGPALLGYPDLREAAPALALLIIAADYSLPMAALMRLRGMAWRPTLEMAGATIAVAVGLLTLTWLGLVPASSLGGWLLGFCGPACAAMLAAMLFRLDLYTGRTGHRMGHQERSPQTAHVA